MKFVMKSKSLIFACFVVLALATAGMASGGGSNDNDTCPGNKKACKAIGGTFTHTGSRKTCVVIEEPEEVTCDRPRNNPFSADISGSTTTYKKEGGKCTIKTTEGGKIIACYNGQGKQTSVNACKNKGCT